MAVHAEDLNSAEVAYAAIEEVRKTQWYLQLGCKSEEPLHNSRHSKPGFETCGNVIIQKTVRYCRKYSSIKEYGRSCDYDLVGTV
jgi:hypothetical protein